MGVALKVRGCGRVVVDQPIVPGFPDQRLLDRLVRIPALGFKVGFHYQPGQLVGESLGFIDRKIPRSHPIDLG